MIRLREIAFADIKSGDYIRVESTVEYAGWYDDVSVGDVWATEGKVFVGVDPYDEPYVRFLASGDEYGSASDEGTSRKYFLLLRKKPDEPTKFGALVKDSNSTYIRVMPSDNGDINFVDIGDMSQNGIILWDSIEDDVEILFTGVDLD